MRTRETTLRDFARLGELMRNRAAGGAGRFVPESWVDASTRPCPLNATYGYLWWLTDDPKGFAARGFLDTHCYVFPGNSSCNLIAADLSPGLTCLRPSLTSRENFALFKRMVRK